MYTQRVIRVENSRRVPPLKKKERERENYTRLYTCPIDKGVTGIK